MKFPLELAEILWAQFKIHGKALAHHVELGGHGFTGSQEKSLREQYRFYVPMPGRLPRRERKCRVCLNWLRGDKYIEIVGATSTIYIHQDPCVVSAHEKAEVEARRARLSIPPRAAPKEQSNGPSRR